MVKGGLGEVLLPELLKNVLARDDRKNVLHDCYLFRNLGKSILLLIKGKKPAARGRFPLL